MSVATACKELQMFFGTPKISRSPKLVACYDSTTLAIIKPHAIQAGTHWGFTTDAERASLEHRAFLAGHLVEIIADITANGFIITALKMFELDRENSEEFFEVYKGVVSEYLVIY